MLAIVSTMADNPERVDYFIRYHLSKGFGRIYIFFDRHTDPAIDCAARYPQVKVTVCDETWKSQCKKYLESKGGRDTNFFEKEVMIRQEINAAIAIDYARHEKVSWLLHIDSDELFYSKSGSAKKHFEELDKLGIDNVQYKNHEALIHGLDGKGPFKNTVYFKNNFFQNNVWNYSASQRALLRKFSFKPEYYFHYYQNGKSAVRLEKVLDVDGVHFFRTEKDAILWDQKDTRILHFPCETYTDFESKYKILGSFSDDWLGEPRAGDYISLIHLKARDAYMKQGGNALKSLFESELVLNNNGLISELLAEGLLCQISDLHDDVKTQVELVGNFFEKRDALLNNCRSAIISSGQLSDAQKNTLLSRINKYYDDLYSSLRVVYRSSDIVEKTILSSVQLVIEAFASRDPEFELLDTDSQNKFGSLCSNRRVGACIYIDRFAENIKGLCSKIDYLNELGINFLYLMPPFKTHPCEDDGGFAIADYKCISDALGSNKDFSLLVNLLKKNGISLCLDFVLNHTASSHEWALKAQKGDVTFRDYYLIYDSRDDVNLWLKDVEDTFPDQGKNIKYVEEIDKYVWATFNDFQWDLNYRNHNVFLSMLDNLLHIVNLGVDAIRLDAIPHIWKELGTSCKNLAECHQLVKAYKALASLVSPSVTLISEAMVSPEEVKSYVTPNGTSYAYRPLLSASLWQALMCGDTRILLDQVGKWSYLPFDCNWINYVNSHDDLQWVFSNMSLREMEAGFNVPLFYKNLKQFYFNPSDKTFSRGLAFQGRRLSGTTASLVGLEKALERSDVSGVDKSISRILLMHAVILSIGGLPVIYLGDEVGELNDYSFREDNHKAHDSRWVHRRKRNWVEVDHALQVEDSIESRLFLEFKQMIQTRKLVDEISGCCTRFIPAGDRSLLAYVRESSKRQFMFLGNFSPLHRPLRLKRSAVDSFHGWKNILSGEEAEFAFPDELQPYEFYWLQRVI
ncbi:glycosyltransferase family 2 protein [Vibrio vulnificus]|nr:glycosyltransferase family 2 protein [Vibrio vulnificus]